MMKKRLVYMPFLLFTFLFTVTTIMAQTPVTAALIAPDGPFSVGDPIELELVVTHPQGYQVIPPELPEKWGDFLVKGQAPATTVTLEDGKDMTVIAIDARLFAPGEFSTPPLTVSITDGTGQLNEATAEPIPVTVSSVLVEGDNALRDIKPQAELPFVNLLPWMAGGFLLAAFAAAGFLWWKRHQARLALDTVDNRLPHEIALDDLARIRQLDLPKQERFKEHYTLVSDTIRTYIERTQGVPLLERTTGEIRNSLSRSTLTDADKQRVITFLQESDLVKFSTFTPTEAEAYGLIAQAQEIVEATQPPAIVEDDLNNQGGANNTPANPTFLANGEKQNSEVSA